MESTGGAEPQVRGAVGWAGGVRDLSGRRAALMLVGALTVVGVVLRAVGLDQGLFGDELFTYARLEGGRGLGGVLREVATTHTPGSEITPPLYFVLAWVARHLGGELATTIRLPSLVFGTALIPLVFVLGTRLLNRSGAVMAAAVTTLAPFAIFYSQEARAYATLAFLTCLSTLCLLNALRNAKAAWWVAYAFSLAAVAYAHYTAIFVLAAQTLWALWYHRPHRRPLLLATAGAVLLYLPWLPHLSGKAGVFAFGAFDASRIPGQAVRVLPGHPIVPLEDLPGTVALVVFLAVLVTGAVLSIHRALERRRGGGGLLSPPAVLLVLLALATPLGLLAYSTATDHFLLIARNYSASFPALALVAAAVLTGPRPRVAVTLSALALASLAVGTIKILTPAHSRPAGPDIAAYIDAHARPSDPVYDGHVQRSPVLRGVQIYFKRRHNLFPATGPGIAQMWAAGARTGSNVFVVVPDAFGAVQDSPAFVPAGYRLVTRRDFPGFFRVQVREYAPVGESAGTTTPGFAPTESDGRHRWHWAIAPLASLHLANPARRPARVTLTATLFPPPGGKPEVLVTFPGGATKRIRPPKAGTPVRETFPLPETGGTIRFSISGAPAHAPNDPRPLYLQVQDLKIATDRPPS